MLIYVPQPRRTGGEETQNGGREGLVDVMSVRGLWVFSNLASDYELERVLFSRCFPTVERRAQYLQGSSWVELPEDDDFCDAVFRELGLKRSQDRDSEEFDAELDSCMKVEQKPVHAIKLRGDASLWPVVIIEKFGLVFASLPLVETDTSHQRPPLIDLPGVSVGYCLLHAVVDSIGSWSSKEMLLSKLKDLQAFLCVATPFGTPVDMNPATVQALITGKDIILPAKGKQPTWKPVQHKGKPQLSFSIREEMRAAQYNNETVKDQWQLFGTIWCRADIEGIPEVTASLMSPALEYLIVHPCVLEGDTHLQATSTQSSQLPGGPGITGRKLLFKPPAEPFPLCHYSGIAPHGLPIRGIYQMKGDKLSVQISVQVKLNEKVKNSFEYCELHLPFFHRGPILHVETAGPSCGNIAITSEQRKLVWNVGQKFPSKTLEGSLFATVHFKDTYQPTKTFPEDPFCTDLNSYAQVFLKMQDFSLTGCSIDPRSLVVYPGTKCKLNTSYEFITGDYKIWNTHGEGMMAHSPPEFNT